MGLRYAFVIVLPIVSAFFFLFALLEDSGYLPRVSMLSDRLLKPLGLSGRAVIPLTLGFGCGAMGTITTRILPTNRERVIATFLLALSIPCSAQLGLIMGVLSFTAQAFIIWLLVITAVFIVAGLLSARYLPGKTTNFFMEIPPLRLPKLKNIIWKTGYRIAWYAKEVIPIFLVLSLLVWLASHFGILKILERYAAYPLRLLELPGEVATILIYGFFRRDYGAAGLYDLYSKNMLSTQQLVVTAVVLTLFLPCMAQLMVMVKERGVKIAFVISLAILVTAFSVGVVLNLLLTVLQIF